MCQVQHEETVFRRNVMYLTLTLLNISILKYTKHLNKAALDRLTPPNDANKSF